MSQNSAQYPDITVTVTVNPPPAGSSAYFLTIATSVDGRTSPPGSGAPPDVNQKISMIVPGTITFKIDITSGWSFQSTPWLHLVHPLVPMNSWMVTVDSCCGIVVVTPDTDSRLSNWTLAADGSSVSVDDEVGATIFSTYSIVVVNPAQAAPNNVLILDPTIKDQAR
ncbi:MAG: hypothetical protein Q8N44_02055 [Rubrivivax sp.]|nr:hypothetical protein [Rubrivivax sp.]